MRFIIIDFYKKTPELEVEIMFKQYKIFIKGKITQNKLILKK